MNFRTRSKLHVLCIRVFFLRFAEVGAQESEESKLWIQAQQAEGSWNPEHAFELYQDLIARFPTSRLARQAQMRINYFEQRLEGGFAPLAALMRIQSRANDVVELERFQEQLSSFPKGRVRREGYALLADAWLQAGREDEALRAVRVWRSEANDNEFEKHRAVAALSRLVEKREGTEQATRILQSESMEQSDVALEIRMRARARYYRFLAWMMIILFFCVFVVVVRSRWRRVLTIRRLLCRRNIFFCIYLFLLPWGLASLYDASASAAFALLTSITAPLFVLALSGCRLFAARQGNRDGKRRALAYSAIFAHAGATYLVVVAKKDVLGLGAWIP